MESKITQLSIVQITRFVGELIRRPVACLNAFGYPYQGGRPQTCHGSTVERVDGVFESFPCDSGASTIAANHVFVSRIFRTPCKSLVDIFSSWNPLYIKYLAVSRTKFRYPYLICRYCFSEIPTINSYERRGKRTLAVSRTERALMFRKFMTRRRDYYSLRLIPR